MAVRKVLKDCGYCDGKGWIEVYHGIPPTPERKPCPISRGSPKVRVDSNSIRCGVCGGKGKLIVPRIMGEDEKVCSTCLGTGWVVPREY